MNRGGNMGAWRQWGFRIKKGYLSSTLLHTVRMQTGQTVIPVEAVAPMFARQLVLTGIVHLVSTIVALANVHSKFAVATVPVAFRDILLFHVQTLQAVRSWTVIAQQHGAIIGSPTESAIVTIVWRYLYIYLYIWWND